MRCATGGSLPCWTSAASSGASLRVFGNFVASVTMTGPSSLPSGNFPAVARPDAAALALAPALDDGFGFTASGVHAARTAAPPAAADIFRRSRRLRPRVATRSRVAIEPLHNLIPLTRPLPVLDIGARYRAPLFDSRDGSP